MASPLRVFEESDDTPAVDALAEGNMRDVFSSVLFGPHLNKEQQMKRIIFAFDGTTNTVDAENPTNVLLTASCITPETSDGIKQIVHYDNGVGTDRGEKGRGSLFGLGLYKNIEQAYQFLIFNYNPGDEIYVFGFSRGAFTARSFVGFVKYVGVIERHNAAQIKTAIGLYKNSKGQNALFMNDFKAKYSSHICMSLEEDHWRCENVPNYEQGKAEQFQFKYVGVWDTVESLGFWKVTRTFIPGLRNRPYKNPHYSFHDHSLSKIVASARHAIAADEERRAFDVTPWDNLNVLNESVGFEPDDEHAPYQQKHFPGTHGSIGGGGPVRGLSDAALAWIWEGATNAGLSFDVSPTSRIYETKPDYRVSLHNGDPSKPQGAGEKLPKTPRSFRPKALYQIHQSAINRWNHPNAEEIDGGKYQPITLKHLSSELDHAQSQVQIENKSIGGLISYNGSKDAIIFHTVVRGDTLSKLAERYLGDAKRFPEIFAINKGLVDDPDKIYVGQILKIPKT